MAYSHIQIFNPDGTSWTLKVLLVLKALHGTLEGQQGSKVEDIVNLLKRKYCLKGFDIRTEVASALKRAIQRRFVYKVNDRFILISPAASIQLIMPSKRADEISVIERVFPIYWCDDMSDERYLQLQPEQLQSCEKIERILLIVGALLVTTVIIIYNYEQCIHYFINHYISK